MEVSVQEESGLRRQVTVTVPADRVNRELDERLRRLAREVKMPGFRPGKVPVSVVEQKYKDRVYGEVMNHLVSETYTQALEERELSPVAQPELDPGELRRDTDFSYTATFEIYPEIEPQGYTGLEITQPVAEVGATAIDETIERLRASRATYEPVDRAAGEGDQLVIDFVGRIDGEPFEGGEASDYTLELGSGRTLEALEQGLSGVQSGETRTVEVPFPEEYPREDLAGKTAEFQVTVKEVWEKQLPEMDEELVRSFGVEDGSVETFREEIRQGLEREVEEHSKEEARRQIFDQLAQTADFEVPDQLVEQQLHQLVQSHKDQYRQQGLDPETLDLDSDAIRDQFRETAVQRVKVGLLIPEIARTEGLETSEAEVRQELERIADRYGEQRDQFLQYVMQNQDQMQEIEGRALETKVIDWILENAQVTENPASVGELLGWEGTGDRG